MVSCVILLKMESKLFFLFRFELLLLTGCQRMDFTPVLCVHVQFSIEFLIDVKLLTSL